MTTTMTCEPCKQPHAPSQCIGTPDGCYCDAYDSCRGNVSKKNDTINHPSHYTRGKIEVWDFIIDQNLNYCCGTVVKYLCRAGYKDPSKHVEDLKKARAFLDREIKRVEGS